MGLEGNNELNVLILAYFSSLFSSDVIEPDIEVINKVKLLTAYTNDTLTTPYSAEELRKSLFSIDDLKAPMVYMLFFVVPRIGPSLAKIW